MMQVRSRVSSGRYKSAEMLLWGKLTHRGIPSSLLDSEALAHCLLLGVRMEVPGLLSPISTLKPASSPLPAETGAGSCRAKSSQLCEKDP